MESHVIKVLIVDPRTSVKNRRSGLGYIFAKPLGLHMNSALEIQTAHLQTFVGTPLRRIK